MNKAIAVYGELVGTFHGQNTQACFSSLIMYVSPKNLGGQLLTQELASKSADHDSLLPL